jgi:hypothetical protein
VAAVFRLGDTIDDDDGYVFGWLCDEVELTPIELQLLEPEVAELLGACNPAET